MMNREELINAFRQLGALYARDDIADTERERLADALNQKIDENTLDPEALSYFYYDMEELTPEELADKILSYKPIAL